jgi:hypothetical protein
VWIRQDAEDKERLKQEEDLKRVEEEQLQKEDTERVRRKLWKHGRLRGKLKLLLKPLPMAKKTAKPSLPTARRN